MLTELVLYKGLTHDFSFYLHSFLAEQSEEGGVLSKKPEEDAYGC